MSKVLSTLNPNHYDDMYKMPKDFIKHIFILGLKNLNSKIVVIEEDINS